MKFRTLTIMGIIISIICILIIASSIEQGDTNAVSMYLVVFLVPSCIVVLLNAWFLSFLRKQKVKLMQVVSALLPVIILSVLSFQEHLTFGGIDGNLVFVAQVGAVALGITNLLWIVSVLRSKEVDFDKSPKRV